jgi:hypothetical protein
MVEQKICNFSTAPPHTKNVFFFFPMMTGYNYSTYTLRLFNIVRSLKSFLFVVCHVKKAINLHHTWICSKG